MEKIVKVQLPIDMARARKENVLYPDESNPNVLVYDRKQRHYWQGEDPELRAFMNNALGGQGYMKAFMKARWNRIKERWDINYHRGFIGGQDW